MSKIQPSGFALQDNQPLIGITVETDGGEVVLLFVDEEEADTAISQDTTQDALNLAVHGVTWIGRKWKRP